MTKLKIITSCLLISSGFVLLEWGGGHSQFLYSIEWEIIQKLQTDPGAILHPLIILPVFGQILLLVHIILPNPSKWLLPVGIGSMSLIMILVLSVGIIGLNLKIIISLIPFTLLSATSLMLRKSHL